jgi:integrase
MSTRWIKTEFNGIRYREHPSRKHGVKPDRYYNLRFSVGGHMVDQSLGWASEGMTLQKAALVMADLKEELRLGKGSGRLADRQKAQRQVEEEARVAALERERLATTYETFFREHYEPKLVYKKAATAEREIALHRLWIFPVIANRPVRDLAPLDLERIRHRMLKAGRAARTAHYAMAVIRMVINVAIKTGYFVGTNPVADVRRMKFDNRRTRFLSHEEADALLGELTKRSPTVHNMAVLALHAGFRLGELYNLRWSDIDVTHSLITVRDTKSGRTRSIPMSGRVRQLFISADGGDASRLVFPDKEGRQRKGNISNSFDRAVDALGFNEGITDRRQRVTFHTLRHTCASWLAMAGVELYTIKEILGHQTIQMTERYSHLCPSRLKAAVATMESAIQQRTAQIVSLRAEGGGNG